VEPPPFSVPLLPTCRRCQRRPRTSQSILEAKPGKRWDVQKTAQERSNRQGADRLPPRSPKVARHCRPAWGYSQWQFDQPVSHAVRTDYNRCHPYALCTSQPELACR
jgi:hypothetical protein